jgi:6-pyruvoyltetrahydropterin/6-carboxytetrahydropterin synthase
MYRITKRWTFDAAHQLHGLPDGHKCGRLHGHTYTVEIEVSAEELDDHGFVVDFADLAPIKQLIDKIYDHRFLNDVLPASTNPTAEKLATILYAQTRMIYVLRRSRGGDNPLDLEVVISRCDPILLHDVVPLPDGVEITAVRVSETGSSWAEYRK